MAGILASLFSERQWTLADLMNVDYSRQRKSTGCQANLLETYVEVEPEGIVDKFKRFFTRNKSVMNIMFVIFKFEVISETGHSYTVFLRTQYDPEMRLVYKNIVQIYCECADFKFKSAWKLEQHSALFRSDSVDLKLGPAITNAPKRPSPTVLCKHAFAAVNLFINNYGSFMSYV